MTLSRFEKDLGAAQQLLTSLVLLLDRNRMNEELDVILKLKIGLGRKLHGLDEKRGCY